jgi:hypothetical protein
VATAGQGDKADDAYAWGDHASAGYAPGVHAHVEADITNLDKYSQAQVNALLAGKSDTTHLHDATYLKVDGSNVSAAAVFTGKHSSSGLTPAAGIDKTLTVVTPDGNVELVFKDGLLTGPTP